MDGDEDLDVDGDVDGDVDVDVDVDTLDWRFVRTILPAIEVPGVPEGLLLQLVDMLYDVG